MAEECPVCYENPSGCKLVCGHEFCKSCVKKWYMKGGTCPMCRRKVHYRRMPIKLWKKEADEEKKNQVFQESFDELIEEMMEPMTFSIKETPDEDWEPDVPRDRFDPVVDTSAMTLTLYRKNVSTCDIEELEKTFRAIKDQASPDEIDYVLNESMDYYSDRRIHLNNRTYSEVGHWYPHEKKDRRRGRGRDRKLFYFHQ